MSKALLYSYAADDQNNELELLEKILENYEINYSNIEKVRSAYKITNEKNVYCLKKLGRGFKRAHKSFYLSNVLQDKGFKNVAPYIYTKEKQYLIKYRKSSFYITQWIDGKEVNFKNIDDILDCAQFLAEFHLAAKNLEIPDDIKIRDRHGNWLEHFNKYTDDIKQFAAKAGKKSSGFDLIYRKNLNLFMSEAQFAIDLIKTKEAQQAFEEAKREKYICHDSFYYQNILRDRYGMLFIVDLESSLLDCPMSDLGKFIRRILCKTKFKWDFDLCRRIIDAYDSIRPISEEELYPLLAIIAYPHKYWKFGRKRYIKKKQWSEKDYQDKIKKVINLESYKIEMIRNFAMFYGIKS